jgi:hypothetical protein
MMGHVDVKPDHMMMLEKAHYELSAYAPLMRQFAGDSLFKPDPENFKILLDRFEEKHVEAEIQKTALLKMYAPWLAGRDFWFDFANCRIVFEDGLPDEAAADEAG